MVEKVFKEKISSYLYMANVRKPYKRYARKPYKSSKRVVRKPTGTFKKKVMSIIHSRAEDRTAYKTSDYTFNSGINSVSELYSIMPPVTQGSDSGNRTGNQVTGKYIDVKGHLQMLITNTLDVDCRIGVRLLIMTPKSTDYSTGTIHPNLLYMLDAGNTNTQFNGLVEDLYLPIDRNYYTVHFDKVYFMNIAQIVASSGSPTAGWVSRDTANTIKFFHKRIPIKRIIKYGDSLAYPMNCNPIICLGYAHLDGSTPDTVQTQVYMKYLAKFCYEDF